MQKPLLNQAIATIRGELDGGLATLVDGEKLRSAYLPPVLKRKHSSMRDRLAA